MKEKVQARARRLADEPRYVVGMDAHSRRVALSVWDWRDRYEPVVAAEIGDVGVGELAAVYRERIDADSVTVVEASTNTWALKRALGEAGYRVEAVRSDTLDGMAPARKVRDRLDARNLALAYIRGAVGDFVWAPAGAAEERREMLAAYREATRDATRLSNRIWCACSAHGLPLPAKGLGAKAASVDAAGLSGFARERLETMLEDYARACGRRGALAARMAEAVASDPALLRLMQLPGINYKGAFALAAAVGDVRRFATPAKLAAYGGFAPVVGTSGEEEARAKRRGGTGRPLDGEGRRDIKFFFTEAAQAVMRSCGGTDLGRWGRALFNRGKDWNKAVCAVGRKLLVYAWHVMAGHPAPGREGEELFARKMRAFHKKVGARRMRQLGHGSAASFAARMARDVYGHLPQPACDADKLPGGKDLEKLNEHRDPCGAAVPT